jgi:hypothetical protein
MVRIQQCMKGPLQRVGTIRSWPKTKDRCSFHVSVILDDVYFGQGVGCTPGSIQPIIYTKEGERVIVEMRWGSSFPTVSRSMRVQTARRPIPEREAEQSLHRPRWFGF